MTIATATVEFCGPFLVRPCNDQAEALSYPLEQSQIGCEHTRPDNLLSNICYRALFQADWISKRFQSI